MLSNLRRVVLMVLMCGVFVNMTGCCAFVWMKSCEVCDGRVVTMEERKEIVGGESTKGDILALLGEPTAVVDKDGDEVWEYVSSETKKKQGKLLYCSKLREETTTTTFMVYFDGDVVENVGAKSGKRYRVNTKREFKIGFGSGGK